MSRAARLSRPAMDLGLGKNDTPAKTLLPEVIRFELEAKVRSEGFRDLSEWLRWVCIAKARGVEGLRSVTDRKLASVSEIVPEKVR